MKRTVFVIFTVFALVCANVVGVIIFYPQSANTLDSIHNGYEPEIKDREPDSNEEVTIPWHLLSSEKNPAAKLFLEEELVAIEFELPELTIEETEDGDLITLEDTNHLLDPGKPMVPELRFFIAVPFNSAVKSIEIVDEQTRQLEGYHVPVPYIPRTLDGQVHTVDRDESVYSSNNAFPSVPYQISGPDKLRHLDVIEISLYPIQARPALGIIEVHDLMRLCIRIEPVEGQELTPPVLSSQDEMDMAVLDSVVNPDDVHISTSHSSKKGTRAPSSIYHTRAFRAPVNAIHPIKDTTVGNVGGAALLQTNDDQYYDSEAGKTMYVDGFDVGAGDLAATLDYALLHLQYVGPTDYDGTSLVRWAKEGDTLKFTTIHPTDLGDVESTDETYDLLGHAESPVTVNDLVDLDIEFTENGVGPGSKDIPFDYIWIEFAYRVELTGDSDYLIVTSLEMADELLPLAEWKSGGLGIDTQVYDTDWIDDNWDGPDLMHRIRDFITSMYENYSIEWVLLGGDENIVPANTSKYDNFYADVTGFYYPDLAIGRLATDDEDLMAGMVDDILVHQRDMQPWKRNMYLIGTNVFNTDDGKRDMLYIKDHYLDDHDLNFIEDYESIGNITRTRTINTYNLGMGNSVITGHGSQYGWYKKNGTQNFFNRNDVKNSMTNADKRGFVWSSTCSSGAFIGGTECIGEVWVRARGGGGIGYVGAGEIAYYSTTMWLYRGFYRAYDDMLDSGQEPTQGVAHMRAMNTNYYRIYNLFGDPQVGLTIVDPKIELAPGRFDSGSFMEQKGFDQNEQVSFDLKINYPNTALPSGVHVNFSVHNQGGAVYYPSELYFDDPEDTEEKLFHNWTVPSGAAAGIYNVTLRLYNTSQNWEFVYTNETYLFVDYKASVLLVEQVAAEVVEGDTVIFRIHIDNYEEPIPAARVWIQLDGRNYDPYMTPFDYNGFNITAIPVGSDLIVEVEITVLQPGTYNVTAGLSIEWALMDSVVGSCVEAWGIRILDVSSNHPLYFRGDTANISYLYFAVTDFTGNASINVEQQSSQLYTPCDFFNGTGWLNFTWTVPADLPNGMFDIDLEICGLGRSLEINADDMRVVFIREIIEKGIDWLLPRQEPDGGWKEYHVWWAKWMESNRNDTARALQALLWSGMPTSDPFIQDAADYVENSLDLNLPGEIDELSQNIWALKDAERGNSQNVQDSSEVFRKMQNWIYEPETWGLYFFSNINSTWLANITCYDTGDDIIYYEQYNGSFNGTWAPLWLNFTVWPGTVKLNVTIKTSAPWIAQKYLIPPLYQKEPWWGLWVDDHWGMGDGIEWNCTASEEIEFDYGWGKQKGMPSLAGFTAWGVIGLLQSDNLGVYERESLYTGVQWLLDNQSADGSWYPIAVDGAMGGGWYPYPESCVDSWIADPVQNTALPVIALIMNGTTGSAVDDAVSWLKLQQADDGSYPYNPIPWAYRVNLVSTAHTIRALSRAGYIFDSGYIKEGARWLCTYQIEITGGWDDQYNYTRVTTEAMMALAFINYQNSIHLEEGWNLISINLISSDTSLNAILKSIENDYDAVQYYDSSDSNNPWKHNSVSKPSELNDLGELDHRIGFWVHITKAGGTTFDNTGKTLFGTQYITLHPGWNLVGFPSLTDKTRLIGLGNLIFGIEVDAIFTFEAATQTWEAVGPGDDFELGRGYWVHATQECVWEIPL